MKKTWFQTTAIDYPNSRPHIGTAFEKLGADVQARYRRMEGYEVFFLMGNDENTLKVADKAKELGLDTQAYCDDMARQFQEVWKALDISYDTFIQTSHERHKECCRKFIQKVYDNGHIYKGQFEGWFCPGCEEFKSDKIHEENAGQCPNHKKPLIRRAEPCWFFKLSAFSDRLLKHLKENPDFVQPESRRNEMIGFIEAEGLKDLNISRHGEQWGIRLPFDPEFTIYVWFDALLTYITGIGYGDDESLFRKYWPADTHFIGKDITRFHTHIWPAMLWAAGEEAPKKVFSHGFVYRKNEATGDVEKIGKALGNVVEPMEVISKFSVDAFRYFFLRECAYSSDGEFGWVRFAEVYNSELANNLGNLYSRCATLVSKNYQGKLQADRLENLAIGYWPSEAAWIDTTALKELVPHLKSLMESCQYNVLLQHIWQQIITPANRYAERMKPWELVKNDASKAHEVLKVLVRPLYIASILLKPFMPRAAESLFRSFEFSAPHVSKEWIEVQYDDAMNPPQLVNVEYRINADFVDGKPKPLFPRIG